MLFLKPFPTKGCSGYFPSEQSFLSVSLLDLLNLVESYLTKEADYSLETVSVALTHSDEEITKTYVNTRDVVNQTVGDIAFRSLK